jgi:hypothetical protein
MVKEGIILGYKFSGKGIQGDRAKIEAIERLPPPHNMNVIRCFIGQASFYRCFITNFSKVPAPLTKLLQNGVRF